MIEFQKVIVKNFYSIGEAELNFDKGVFLVYGKNNDVVNEVDTSNGAGKTSLFNAIYQGLFNKNLKEPKGLIDSVSNFYTGEPYYIEVYFKKGNNQYKVVNNRAKGKIYIYKNDDNISLKTINQNLKLIQDILGFDFKTFASLTFLNQVVLENIIDMTSQNNLLYQFFNLDSLKNLEKLIKNKVKDLKQKRILLTEKEQEYINYLSILKSVPENENRKLEKNLLLLRDNLSQLEYSQLAKDIEKYNSELESIREQYKEVEKKVYKVETEYNSSKEIVRQISKGTCPVCGQKTTKVQNKYSDKINLLKNKLDGLKREKEHLYRKGSDLKNKVDNLKNEYYRTKKELETEIALVEKEVIKTAQDTKFLNNLKENRKQYEEKLKQLKEELNFIQQYLDLYALIIQIITKGYLTEIYLKTYINLLRVNLKKYLTQTYFSFDINVTIKKGNLFYTFVDGEIEKTFGQLSSGEKVRVSLVVLLANLTSLQQLTGIEVNFLVFDELLGALDEEGLEFIKKAINSFRKDKSVFIISHHDEINSNFADYLLYVIKENNIASIKVENIRGLND